MKNLNLKNIKIYKTPLFLIRGLMFSRKKSIILDLGSEQTATIHMFFVFFLIDVAWLDKNKKVVDIKRKVMPFTPLVTPRKKARYILESPDHINAKIGDKLKIY